MHFHQPPNSNAIDYETPKKGPIATKEKLTLDDIRKKFELKLDVCATAEFNSCCEEFFTPEIDGLKQEWTKNFYMNPPGYSEEQIEPWLNHAINQAQKYKITGVALLPSYTGADWFQDFCLELAHIRFLRGRVPFWRYGEPLHSTPNFYSLLAIWSFEK